MGGRPIRRRRRPRRDRLSVSSFFIEETSREVVKFDCLSIDLMLLAVHCIAYVGIASASECEESRSRCMCSITRFVPVYLSVLPTSFNRFCKLTYDEFMTCSFDFIRKDYLLENDNEMYLLQDN